MANAIESYWNDLRATKVWRSVFRSGAGSGNLHSALSVQQNVFLHLASVKMRRRSLAFGATWYLGTLTLATFLILTGTGILLMLYYHPSVPQAYADMKDLNSSSRPACFCAICIAGPRRLWCSWYSPTCSKCSTGARTVRRASSTG